MRPAKPLVSDNSIGRGWRLQQLSKVRVDGALDLLQPLARQSAGVPYAARMTAVDHDCKGASGGEGAVAAGA